MNDLYIGLMSGTSADGIDAVLVEFSQTKPHVIATHYTPYPETLRQQILALCQPGENEIQRLGELDTLLGTLLSEAANSLIHSQSLTAKAIRAIGSHGQTIRHAPNQPHRFTLQIGDPNTIAALTGITTVADFRRKDVACGGQGAPLVPAFHHDAFASASTPRAIVNIGGMANVTLLPTAFTTRLIGFDTGPGNALLDGWIQTHQQQTHDQNGAWGAQGTLQKTLLTQCLSDPYFQLPPPKSTGREHFNQAWLRHQLASLPSSFTPRDIQATLTELTAQTIVNAIASHLPSGDILVCGGGAHNTFLMNRLTALAAPAFQVRSTESDGIHPDWVEAIAFAWLAKRTLEKKSGNLPSVTGANQASILGGIYYA